MVFSISNSNSHVHSSPEICRRTLIWWEIRNLRFLHVWHSVRWFLSFFECFFRSNIAKCLSWLICSFTLISSGDADLASTITPQEHSSYMIQYKLFFFFLNLCSLLTSTDFLYTNLLNVFTEKQIRTENRIENISSFKFFTFLDSIVFQ